MEPGNPILLLLLDYKLTDFLLPVVVPTMESENPLVIERRVVEHDCGCITKLFKNGHVKNIELCDHCATWLDEVTE